MRRRARKTSSSASPCTIAALKRPGCECCRRCGSATRGRGTRSNPKPSLRESAPGVIQASHQELGEYRLYCDAARELLFTENESNASRLWGQPNATPYVKDAFHTYVVSGHRDAVNPAKVGTKAAAHYVLDVPGGGSQAIRLRLAKNAVNDAFSEFDAGFTRRIADADEFYDRITPESLGEDQRRVHRQALAGMLWSKQFYFFDLEQWLSEHGSSPLMESRRGGVRNTEWSHMLNSDVISMPDKWEYPWYAAWDLAFHTIALSMVDFDFAKEQLLLMLRSLYFHPSGQIPAYEWNFSDVNPPVHAFATLYLYKVERTLGRSDLRFLERSFQGSDAQLQLVGQPQGSRRTQRVRGRISRPRQHRHLRSKRAASDGRIAGAGGRHGMDGVLLPEHAGNGPHSDRIRPDVRRHCLQVPPAFHVDLLRNGPHRRTPGRDVG